MLTAKGEEIDRVIGFELGADDYIVKPFSVRELLLRVQAVLRRVSTGESAARRRSSASCAWTAGAHRVWVDGQEVELTALEFKLLLTLHDRRNRVQTRDALLSDVWKIDADVTTRTVDTHVNGCARSSGPRDLRADGTRRRLPLCGAARRSRVRGCAAAPHAAALHEQRALVHAHAALKRQRPGASRSELDGDGLVQRERLLDVEFREDRPRSRTSDRWSARSSPSPAIPGAPFGIASELGVEPVLAGDDTKLARGGRARGRLRARVDLPVAPAQTRRENKEHRRGRRVLEKLIGASG